MTTETATISLRALTDHVREDERRLAPGSETDLWGQYCERMREVTGVLPTDDFEGDPQVTMEEAAWWLGAYTAANWRHETGSVEGELPTDEDLRVIAGMLGIADYRVPEAGGMVASVEEGFGWYVDQLPEG